MANQRRKLPERLQGKGSRFRGSSSAVLPKTGPDAREIPAPPTGITIAAKRQWNAYWRSDVSWAVDPNADREGLRRWIVCVSERGKFERELKRNPTAFGSTGQVVVNPIAALIAQFTKEINRAEDHLGMTPLSRMRLGIAMTTAAKGKHDLDALLPPKPVWVEADGGDLAIVGSALRASPCFPSRLRRRGALPQWVIMCAGGSRAIASSQRADGGANLLCSSPGSGATCWPSSKSIRLRFYVVTAARSGASRKNKERLS